jgi:hypothetical protein
MPSIDLLFEELTELKIMRNNRVDHPRKKSKDLADAVCGAVFGAISHTPKDLNLQVEVHTFKQKPKKQLAESAKGVIEYNSIPNDVRDYLDQFKTI